MCVINKYNENTFFSRSMSTKEENKKKTIQSYKNKELQIQTNQGSQLKTNNQIQSDVYFN